MPLQIYPKESAGKVDAAVRAILEHFEERQVELGLGEAVVFHNFPLFREDENLLVAELVLISPRHGIVLISANDRTSFQGSEYEVAVERLEGTFNQIFSKLVRYPRLRAGRAQLAFPVDAFLWAQEGTAQENLRIGLSAIDGYLAAARSALETPLSAPTFEELISVLDGSKALLRPKERKTEGFSSQSRVATVARLEEEIRKFDRDQRVAYMTEVGGPQRIRGLAGSGKTVVLALKAALTAIRDPEARIAVTFYTKSLYQHIKQLITRFYRLYEDRDPDWSKLQVLHAWGGASVSGLYYLAARRFGHQPLTYGQAALSAPQQPFAYACERLLADPSVMSAFDYVFVDEAQDFPQAFMRLALRLADEEKLVIAYDVFQTIFDVEVPTAASLFGTDSDDEAQINFEEDEILHKCYRNPREVLLCAHAIGFGIYGRKIVQILESPEHWEDFGYIVTSGELVANEQVVIHRPRENSPSSISDSNSIDQIIGGQAYDTFREEVEAVADRVRNDVQIEGIPPEDILIICADDKNANTYFTSLRKALAERAINVNNLQDDSYSIPEFQKANRVTLSTIYKAKGNESYCVYIVGIDSLFFSPTARSRNKAFTAMTRAKGWLFVTGVGVEAKAFLSELATAKKNYPDLRFKYPSSEQLVYMKRDLIQIDPEVANEELSRLAAEMDPDEYELLLRKQLKKSMSRRRVKKKKPV